MDSRPEKDDSWGHHCGAVYRIARLRSVRILGDFADYRSIKNRDILDTHGALAHGRPSREVVTGDKRQERRSAHELPPIPRRMVRTRVDGFSHLAVCDRGRSSDMEG